MLSHPDFKRSSTCARYLKVLEERNFPAFPAFTIEGKQLTTDWLRNHGGMQRPIFINGGRDSIRLNVPEAKRVSEILMHIGEDHPVK